MSVTLYSSYWRSFGAVIFTSSQNWVVPLGVYKIKVLAIGGGGGGGGGYSSTYVGGGGGSGAIAYAEIVVTPGQELQIVIGAGGSGGTGGASPTAGGNGGSTYIQMPINDGYQHSPIQASGGYGGGAASSSANGAGGSGGPGANSWPELGMYGITSAFTLAYYAVSGNGASGQNGANTPGLAPSFNASAPIPYGFPNAGGAGEYGGGGGGGGVNANGNPGANGILIIWWGD